MEISQTTQSEDPMVIMKDTAVFIADSLSPNAASLFYAKLSTWAAGMANPKHLEGPTRTEAIRGFFRGMKRKK